MRSNLRTCTFLCLLPPEPRNSCSWGEPCGFLTRAKTVFLGSALSFLTKPSCRSWTKEVDSQSVRSLKFVTTEGLTPIPRDAPTTA